MGIIIEANNMGEYKTALKEHSSKLVVVDFYATWCGPCRAIAPLLKKLADEWDIVVLKVDVDEADDVAKDEEISAMPTFKFYKNDAMLVEFKGANKEKLEQAVLQHK